MGLSASVQVTDPGVEIQVLRCDMSLPLVLASESARATREVEYTGESSSMLFIIMALKSYWIIKSRLAALTGEC